MREIAKALALCDECFNLPFDVYQLPLQLTMCSAIENHLKKIAKHWTMLCPEKLEHIAATTSKTRFFNVRSAGGLEFYACERFTQLQCIYCRCISRFF